MDTSTVLDSALAGSCSGWLKFSFENGAERGDDETYRTKSDLSGTYLGAATNRAAIEPQGQRV
jgi:hypothetical protein